jgi:tRNA dimethylallyltransferase
MELADRLGGVELLSVDSMQVYRGMDIGTAKPTAEERRRVPHHLIDLCDPHEEATVSWFQSEAHATRDAVARRGAIPVFVGGTGLYLRAVIDDLEIPGQWPDLVRELDLEPDTRALHRRLGELDSVAAARMEPDNRRRVIRALEVTIGGGRRFSDYGPGLDHYPPTEVVQIGLAIDRTQLARRIEARFDRQLEAGLVDEVERLDRRPEGWSRTAAQALGYKELLDHVRHGADLGRCRDLAITRTRRFAVRQERWFRRDPRIIWVEAGNADPVGAILDAWSP